MIKRMTDAILARAATKRQINFDTLLATIQKHQNDQKKEFVSGSLKTIYGNHTWNEVFDGSHKDLHRIQELIYPKLGHLEGYDEDESHQCMVNLIESKRLGKTTLTGELETIGKATQIEHNASFVMEFKDRN